MTFLRHTATKSVPICQSQVLGDKILSDHSHTPKPKLKLKTVTETGHSPAPADRKGAYGMRINQLFSDAIRDIEEQMRDPRRKRIH
jgi:hypothetical protein